MIVKTEMTRRQLSNILHAVTNNKKGFVMDEGGFIDDQLRLHNVRIPLFCDHNEGKAFVTDGISGRTMCSICGEITIT